MKKILLLAVAAVMTVSASAQLTSRQNAGKPQTKAAPQQQAVQRGMLQAVPAKQVAPATRAKDLGAKLSLSKSVQRSLTPAPARQFQSKAQAKAAEPQALYLASGIDNYDATAVTWETKTGTFENGALGIVDLIPNVFEFENGVAVEYTLDADVITIKPQLVASIESQGYYIFLVDANSESGDITLKLADNGSLKGNNPQSILYGVFSTPDFDPEFGDTYLGYYSYYRNVRYRLPDEPALAPVATFEPANTVLYAGLGISGYSYNSNLAMTSAYAPFTLRNSTADFATAWSWKAVENLTETPTNLSSTDKDFVLQTDGQAVYEGFELTGDNQGSVSDPATWGIGTAVDNNGNIQYENFYLYGSGSQASFQFTDETYANFTAMDPNGDLTFYTNWATPDLASNSMHKVYLYQGKPAAPLYFEGVTLPLVSFTAKRNFNLNIKIYKCERDGARGTLALGDLIAQGDANSSNVDATYASQSGLTAVTFNELYVEDEWGMSTPIDHLFIDDEFVIVIDGWDNGTFSGVLGCEASPTDNNYISTWFEKTGEPDSKYRYTSWPTKLFASLDMATFGYLKTDGEPLVEIPAEGGQASIHVEPMFYNNDGTTRLFLDNEDEVPEWLELGIANEVYTTDTSAFDLVAAADALPAGVEGREATVTLWQEGALLKLHVTQGTVNGITTTKASLTRGGKTYNLQGMPTKADAKGLVIQNGKKYLNK